MKKSFIKTISVFCTFALLASTPINAMGQSRVGQTASNFSAAVGKRATDFTGWTKKSLMEALKGAQERLDNIWKRYIKCQEGNKKYCRAGQAVAITGILATLGALAYHLNSADFSPKGELFEEKESFLNIVQEPTNWTRSQQNIEDMARNHEKLIEISQKEAKKRAQKKAAQEAYEAYLGVD